MEKRIRNLRWIFCLLLAVVALAAGVAKAEEEFIPTNMKVRGISFPYYDAESGGQSIAVLVGEDVELEPDLSQIVGEAANYSWEDESGKSSSELTWTISRDRPCEEIFTCNFEEEPETPLPDPPPLLHQSKVKLLFVNPLTVGISGTTELMPGDSVTLTATVGGKPAQYASSGAAYVWTVVDSSGTDITAEFLTPIANGRTATLSAGKDENAWKLDGASVYVTATLNKNKSLTATSLATALKVGIVVEPAYGSGGKSVTAAEKNGQVIASIGLDSVYGGNSTASGLSYQWQWRLPDSGAWENVQGEGQGRRLSIDVPAIEWTESGEAYDRGYRCLVGRMGTTPTEEVRSALFRVKKRDYRVDVSADVTLTPASGVVIEGELPGTMRVTGTLDEPMGGGSATYKYAILLENGEDWSTFFEVPSGGSDLKTGAAIEVDFPPLSGTHRYRLLVTASNDLSAVASDDTDSFTVSFVSMDKEMTNAIGYSEPGTDGERIRVDPDKAITYHVLTRGGTGKWRVIWQAGEDASFKGGVDSMDPKPVHGKAVTATALVIGHDGEPVGLEFPISFDAPYVNLTWGKTDFGGKTVAYDEISGDAQMTLLTLTAAGGKGNGYEYSYFIGDLPPASDDEAWESMGDATTLSVSESMLTPYHDFGDGESASFRFWFMATDGEQTIVSDPVVLRVVTEPSVAIDGEGVLWNGEAYAVSFDAGSGKTLQASVVGGSFEGTPTFAWDWDNGELTEGASWTLPDDWTSGDYTATVSAAVDDGTIAPATVIVHVTEPEEAMKVGASLNRSRVVPEGAFTLTVEIETPGSGLGTYEFMAGLDSAALTSMTPVAGKDAATKDFTAPAAEGRHLVHWQVRDTGTGETVSGIELLTVTSEATPLVMFSIFPESGSELAVGKSFNMTVVNEGTRTVAPSELTWAGSLNATVNTVGLVTILAAGDIEITATFEGYTALFAATIPEGGEPVYSIIVPSLTFEAGEPVDAQFETEPAGGTFSYTGDLPGELELSSAGHLTGTAPGRGTYSIESVTVTWPDGHEETRYDVLFRVTGGGGNGGGGGCNGGFGLFALALGAFLALKRK